MNHFLTSRGWCTCFLLLIAALLTAPTVVAETPPEQPLEPPDRSSPRATIGTFLDSIDEAWNLYEAGDPRFEEPFLDAKECLDLSEIPPLVFNEASAEIALLLKEVLDRLELPPPAEIPDAAAVAEAGISWWTIPHTEITLVLVSEGEGQGVWLFSTRTVANAEKYFDKVRHLPYKPGRKGGHVEELRSSSRAIMLLKLTEAMPSWFRNEIGGVFVWQWLGLGLLVVLVALAIALVGWIGKLWRRSRLIGHRLAEFFVPLALLNVPFAGNFMINRIFGLPGAPALVLRLVFSVVGYIGLAWLVALVLTRIGDLVLRLWFHNARPLRKQLVRVIFRIATIVVVTVVVVMAMQRLGVPVAGLVAGLGVGGLAIALAAQSTLENFLGGIILYTDQPVKVGDFCKFGAQRGTVEDVGLRSVKIRTLDQTIITVPNGDFAKMQLENLTDRDRVLLREELRLRYETTQEQLRQVLTELASMLREHPQIADEPMRVRFIGFGQHFLEVELFAYAMTNAWPEFLEIREDVLLKVMDIVEGAGTQLALPTEIHYVGGEQAAEQSSATDRHAT
jgi:MscS family membrane protein